MRSDDEFSPFVSVTIKPQWIRPTESIEQRLIREQIEVRLRVVAAEAALLIRDGLVNWRGGHGGRGR